MMVEGKTIAGARLATGAQSPITWVEAGPARLAVSRRGAGFPVICLSAIGHGARDFENLATRLGSLFEIVAIDWPGHGASPDDGVGPSAAHYATLVANTMDALGIARALVLGNSIGGAAAILLAAGHSDRVAGLVLCNSGGLVAITPFARFIIAGMAAFFRAGENGRHWFPHAYRTYYNHLVLPRAPRAHRERIIAAGPELAGKLRAAWEEFAQPRSDIRSLVPTIACPVFIAWARGDCVIPWSLCKPAARRFPNLTVQLFSGGHSAFVEDAEAFEAAFRVYAEGVR